MYQSTYSPFNRINGMDVLNRFMDNNLSAQKNQEPTDAWTPQLDIIETEDAFLMAIDLPGIDPSAVEITLDKNILSVEGERKLPHQDDQKHRIERSGGKFSRKFTLPSSVDGEHISVTASLGVLEITLPKAVLAKPRSISVQT